MEKPVYEIAAVHDLSGYGRSSLAVVIPILAAMGMQACPLATSILSTQTSGFKNYTFFDFTDHMEKIINHWETLDIKFDAIYSGFLGSSRQIDIIINFIDVNIGRTIPIGIMSICSVIGRIHSQPC